MDKVKTLICGLANGYQNAFKILDGRVEELGRIEIISINDQYLCRAGLDSKEEAIPVEDECVKRTVVYRGIEDKVS